MNVLELVKSSASLPSQQQLVEPSGDVELAFGTPYPEAL
jgi:hypothetical protein